MLTSANYPWTQSTDEADGKSISVTVKITAYLLTTFQRTAVQVCWSVSPADSSKNAGVTVKSWVWTPESYLKFELTMDAPFLNLET